MQLGIDRLFKDDLVDFKNKKVGLLIHPASVNSEVVHTLGLFLSQPKVNVTQLFGPEHGIWGTAQDMEGVESSVDPHSQIPVRSLYGATVDSLKPTSNNLRDIDVLVCDLQDIGTRYYTFIYTMAYCMQACAELGKEVVVLDRPNPINGIDLEGKILQKGFESFVGRYPIPIRHGMTIGEMASFFNEEFNIESKLTVIPMKGWKRSQFFDETGLVWIPPSPNMPTLDTTLVYPGICLIEATNLSEGRGTTHPFEYVGAPFINPHELATKLNELHLEGIIFRPHVFRPTFQKWKDQDCGGVQIHIRDRKAFRPMLTGVALLKTIIDLYPNDFAWRDKPYEFVDDIPAIDLLSGDDLLRKGLEKHSTLSRLTGDWEKGHEDFQKKRKKYLLYL